MGNGPGDFEDYFELIDQNALLCGGFVWEWCDHAIATERLKMARWYTVTAEIMGRQSMMEISV